jgi:hypothetical protein
MKFDVGDILKSRISNFDGIYTYIVVSQWLDRNVHHTPVYRVIKLDDGSQHTWNAEQVRYNYEKVS